MCRLGGKMSTGWWVLIGVAAWLVAGAAAPLVAGRVLWRRSQALEPARTAAESPGQARQARPVRQWWDLQVHRRRRQGRLARQAPPAQR
jgi:hypothetical protein